MARGCLLKTEEKTKNIYQIQCVQRTASEFKSMKAFSHLQPSPMTQALGG